MTNTAVRPTNVEMVQKEDDEQIKISSKSENLTHQYKGRLFYLSAQCSPSQMTLHQTGSCLDARESRPHPE